MTDVSVKSPRLFEITDEKNGRVYFGCSQKWYKLFWQRMSGCGPACVADITSYLERRQSGLKMTKTLFTAHMQEVWRFVTPTTRGLPETRLLKERAERYSAHFNLNYKITSFDMPGIDSPRPALSELLAFLTRALERDAPVAFLSLDRGRERRLDSWHWVTLIAVSFNEGAARVTVLDGGRKLDADLKLWYDTTKRGGGFVAFRGD